MAFVNYQPAFQPILPANPLSGSGGIQPPQQPISDSMRGILGSLGGLVPQSVSQQLLGTAQTQGPSSATQPVATPGAPGAVAGQTPWPVGTTRFGILNPPRGITPLAKGMVSVGGGRAAGPHVAGAPAIPFHDWLSQHIAAASQSAVGTPEHPAVSWLRNLFGQTGQPPTLPAA